TLPGVDVASKGLAQRTFTARGPSGVNSTTLRVLTDDRYARLPSLGFNIPYLIPSGEEEVERIELVRGPGSALHGPGASRGVLQIITRSPLEAQGTAFSVTGGERSLFRGSARHARKIGERLAFRLSGEYLRGDDWPVEDPVEARARATALEAGADPDTLLVGRRDFELERAAAEARIDWAAAKRTVLTASGGIAQAIRTIDITDAGAAQLRDWRYSYLQARLRSGRLLANLFFNRNDAGDTYLLRTGQPVIDDSWLLGTQLRHAMQLRGLHLSYGADLTRTVPRTGSTIHGRREQDDEVLEVGGYVNGSLALRPNLELAAALRADHHDGLDDVALSPRAALVFQPAPGHALRFTFNRAFKNPSTVDLFQDLRLQSLDPLPFALRLVAAPRSGYTFRRDCGGLCMRSPFNPGDPSAFLPADATLLWGAAVALLAAQGIDLSALPAPDGTQVSSLLKTLNLGSGRFETVAEEAVADVPGPTRERPEVFEIGYRGRIADRIRLTADLHTTRFPGFSGGLRVITPSVFFEESSLAAYLSRFIGAEQAGQIAAAIARIPVGTVTPAEALDPADLLLGPSPGPTVRFWGLDVGTEARLNEELSLTAAYSWTSKDSLPGIGVTNTTKSKGSASLAYRNRDLGLTARLQGRAVKSFPVLSGVFQGRVEGYALVDLSVGYRLPWAPRNTLTLTAQNLLDERHREFVGAPELGRVVLTRLQVRF
ncbi:MAG: TonB-dependent receptor domain-containing protein, partial [Gemmatimonadota bacterium]